MGLLGDGHPDLIIQYTDGSINGWYLGGAQGNQILSSAVIAGASSWSVVGTVERLEHSVETSEDVLTRGRLQLTLRRPFY